MISTGIKYTKLLNSSGFIRYQCAFCYLRALSIAMAERHFKDQHECPDVLKRMSSTEALERKNYPVATGVLDYFPDAILAIAKVSKVGNEQHNPGKPLHWDRNKSQDEADACMRHFLSRGTLDTDGIRHTAKAAWRMLALLQKEIEKSKS